MVDNIVPPALKFQFLTSFLILTDTIYVLLDSIPWGSLMRQRGAAENAWTDTTGDEENPSQTPFTWGLEVLSPITRV